MRISLLIPVPQSTALRPLGSEFDRFLYAQVGADSHGGLLSVISALARLGVEPWEQAAILARLPADEAAHALSVLLARLPAAGEALDLAPLTRHLVSLLPRHPHGTERPAAFAVHRHIRISSRWIVPLLVVVSVLLLLAASSLIQR